jgi:hypothetical protein
MIDAVVELWAGAIILLFLAHGVRAGRHVLLFDARDDIRPSDLLTPIGLTYAFNTFLPLRLGEFVRILAIRTNTPCRLSRIAATVVVERLSDMILVALALPAIEAAFSGAATRASLVPSATLMSVGGGVIAGAILVGHSQGARRLVWRCASIFNDRIMLSLVNMAWTTYELLRTRILSRNFVAYTALMWGLYFLAYLLFARATGFSFASVAITMLSAPLRARIVAITEEDWLYLVFFTAPLSIILAYGFIRDRGMTRRLALLFKRLVLNSSKAEQLTLPHAFRELDDYGKFLQAHFSAEAPVVASFGTKGVRGAVIHRTLPGGSEALTAVVEVKQGFRIRKFAIDKAAQKLRVQANWLRTYQSELSLCNVMEDSQSPGAYSYDMPYIPSAFDFYEFVHINPVEKSRALISDVFDHVARFHAEHRAFKASDAVVDDYLRRKVIDNVEIILYFARAHLPDCYSINGESYALADWDWLRDLDWLRAQVTRRGVTAIHGDLTIENIIIAPETATGWYIIDPNPENIFETELIDWAKMMQSLNLGYEGLNRAAPASLANGVIRIMFTRSNAYSELHSHFLGLLGRHFDAQTRREIAFHELVNYLRLMPYKIRNAPRNALTFFAASSILLKAYTHG